MPFHFSDPETWANVPDGMTFQIELWEAINAYVVAGGGDTSLRTFDEWRMSAVKAVDAVVARELQTLAGGRHLLPALQMAYRKHVMDDQAVGWNELSEAMLTALTEAMGDSPFQAWIASIAANAWEG